MYERIKNYLSKEPRARERHLRDRAMINLILEDYPSLAEIPKDTLIVFCQQFESYARIWRKVIEENESLRGSDYETKDIVEQRKQIALGYDPLYNKKIYA